MTKSISIKRKMLFFVAFAVLFSGFIIGSSAVNAETGSGSSTLSSEQRAELEKKKQEHLAEQQKKMEERKAELESKKTELETKREEKKEKFTEKRLEQCQKREARINEKMQKIADRKAKQVETFNKIADRTMAFYEERNLTLANYDALVSDVFAKKGVVEAEIANLKTATVDFQCESEDPLKVSDAFKEARSGLVTAMKDYKTSVKNLIVGVKSVAPSDDTDGGEQ